MIIEWRKRPRWSVAHAFVMGTGRPQCGRNLSAAKSEPHVKRTGRCQNCKYALAGGYVVGPSDESSE